MRRNYCSKFNEQTLREQVGREIARHRELTEQCSTILDALIDGDVDESLPTIYSLPDELGRSSEGLRDALNNLSKSVMEKAARMSDARQKPDPNVLTSREEAAALRARLAESGELLAQRDEQVKNLLNDGLRLALKKEELERRLQTLIT